MSSPSFNVYHGAFTGVSAEVTIGVIPFVAKRIAFYGLSGKWGIKIPDQEAMADDAYVSNSGVDAGVTIDASTGVVTIASGADVNDSGNPVYYEAIG
jgi:hypothetical protein